MSAQSKALLAPLLDLAKRVEEIPSADIPAALYALASVQGGLAARLVVDDMGRQPEEQGQPDRLLTAKEVAPILAVAPRWIYRHHKTLPFTKRLPGKGLRFSEVGLQKYMSRGKH